MELERPAPIIFEPSFRAFKEVQRLESTTYSRLAEALDIKRDKVSHAVYLLRPRNLVAVKSQGRNETEIRRVPVDEETFRWHFDRRFWNDYESEWNREDSQKQE